MNYKINDCTLFSIFLWQTFGQKCSRRVMCNIDHDVAVWVQANSNGVVTDWHLLSGCQMFAFWFSVTPIISKTCACLWFVLLHLIWGPDSWLADVCWVSREPLYTVCSAVSFLCSVEPAAGGPSLEPDVLTAHLHFRVPPYLVMCPFSWILLFFFFVILTKYQQYTLDFTIIVGYKYEGRKHNCGSVKLGLYVKW
jgi:hypothetical protein